MGRIGVLPRWITAPRPIHGPPTGSVSSSRMRWRPHIDVAKWQDADDDPWAILRIYRPPPMPPSSAFKKLLGDRRNLSAHEGAQKW